MMTILVDPSHVDDFALQLSARGFDRDITQESAGGIRTLLSRKRSVNLNDEFNPNNLEQQASVNDENPVRPAFRRARFSESARIEERHEYSRPTCERVAGGQLLEIKEIKFIALPLSYV